MIITETNLLRTAIHRKEYYSSTFSETMWHVSLEYDDGPMLGKSGVSVFHFASLVAAAVGS